MAAKLADKMVRDMPGPASGNRIAYDAEVKGFGIRVTAAGAKAFILNYRAAGRERRITIGSFPDWGVAAARERAKELKRQIDVGADPMADRHEERAAPTMADLADRYIAEHGPRKRPRSLAEDVSMITQIIKPKLGKVRVEAVRRADVSALHREVSASTPIRANRVLSLLTKMFNLAIAWEIRANSPCKGVEKNPEDRRDRYLTPAEIGRLSAALDEYTNQSSADALRLLLLTGARRGELLGATWNQFDLHAGAWTKPAASTKQKKLHRVPLSAPALLLLSEMRAKAKPGVAALFPDHQANDDRAELRRTWKAVCAAAGISSARIHDLRHTHASILASAGLSLPIIGALLGHTQPSTTARYAHLMDDPLRAATERVGAIVAGAGKPAGEVVPMATAKGR